MANKKGIDIVSIFCDYTADGLWIDGATDDLHGLCDELDIPFNKKLSDRLDAWQAQYEKWDFWSDEANPETIYKSQEYLDWDKEGRSISIEIRRIIPNNIVVEYLDEKTGVRTQVIKETNTDG